MNSTDEIDKVASLARSSLSYYCINVCRAKCCKFGKLVLFNDTEVDAVCGTKRKLFEKKQLLERKDTGNYHFDLVKGGCKNLRDDNMCNIHDKPSKPRICDDYPLFIPQKKYVIAADSCPGVQDGLLDEYVEKLQELGLKKI